MTFADASGWYVAFVPTDVNHSLADAWLANHFPPLLTTDYVIDETLTLLRARGHRQTALQFGFDAFGGKLAIVHFLTPPELAAAWAVFHRFADKDWSFTDCTSKIVMESLGIAPAFAFDQHFRQFGTVAVVP